MAWNQGWEKIFKENEWGKYPPEELIRFISRNFGQKDRKEVRILEVGCGTGANLWYLSREGYSAYGIDGSQVATDRAKTRFDNEGLDADIQTGDIIKLPYADNYFDCVIDIECLYANSMGDSEVIVNEIKRVLKPKGLFFSKTFMWGTHRGALHEGYGEVRFSTEDEIKKLYAPFQINNVEYLIRSENNQAHEVKEWLVTCSKQ